MEGAGTSGNTSHAAFSASNNGALVYGGSAISAQGDELAGPTGRASVSATSASRLKCRERRFLRWKKSPDSSIFNLARDVCGSLATRCGSRSAEPQYVPPRNIGGWNLVTGREYDRLLKPTTG